MKQTTVDLMLAPGATLKCAPGCPPVAGPSLTRLIRAGFHVMHGGYVTLAHTVGVTVFMREQFDINNGATAHYTEYYAPAWFSAAIRAWRVAGKLGAGGMRADAALERMLVNIARSPVAQRALMAELALSRE